MFWVRIHIVRYGGDDAENHNITEYFYYILYKCFNIPETCWRFYQNTINLIIEHVLKGMLLFCDYTIGGGDTGVPISHIPDFLPPNIPYPNFFTPNIPYPRFLPPNIPYPRFHSQLTISQILQD